VHVPPRAAPGGPPLARLLADLQARPVHAPLSASAQTLSDQLSQWLDWTDAIGLSSALSSPMGAPARADAAARPGGAHPDIAMAAQVRRALIDTITGDSAFAPRRTAAATASDRRTAPGGGHQIGAGNAIHARVGASPGAMPPSSSAFISDVALEETFFRQRCLALQQSMETRITHLRAHLRQALAAGSVDGARLAAVDAVLEHALSRKERALLASVPDILGRYFSRLHANAHDGADGMPDDATPEHHNPQRAPRTWVDVFRDTMRGVMLAELALRFEPIDGLTAALHAHTFLAE